MFRLKLALIDKIIKIRNKMNTRLMAEIYQSVGLIGKDTETTLIHILRHYGLYKASFRFDSNDHPEENTMQYQQLQHNLHLLLFS